MKRLTLPLITLAVAACSGEATTAPTKLQPDAISSLSLAGSDAAAAGYSDELSSVENRFLPAFADDQAAAQIRTYIGELRAELDAGNSVEANRLIDLIRAALTPGVTRAADLDAINRVLARYQRDLTSSTDQ